MEAGAERIAEELELFRPEIELFRPELELFRPEVVGCPAMMAEAEGNSGFLGKLILIAGGG